MEMIEYQKLARTTENKTLSDFDRIRNGCYGLCGESGECIDLLKKHEFQGHELDKEKLIDELGDVLWYISQTAAGLGITMEDIARHNISKLKKRYPGGFEANKSINRKEDK